MTLERNALPWLSPSVTFRCEYVSAQVTVKTRYRLWVTQNERDAMARVLETC